MWNAHLCGQKKHQAFHVYALLISGANGRKPACHKKRKMHFLILWILNMWKIGLLSDLLMYSNTPICNYRITGKRKDAQMQFIAEIVDSVPYWLLSILFVCVGISLHIHPQRNATSHKLRDAAFTMALVTVGLEIYSNITTIT